MLIGREFKPPDAIQSVASSVVFVSHSHCARLAHALHPWTCFGSPLLSSSPLTPVNVPPMVLDALVSWYGLYNCSQTPVLTLSCRASTNPPGNEDPVLWACMADPTHTLPPSPAPFIRPKTHPCFEMTPSATSRPNIHIFGFESLRIFQKLYLAPTIMCCLKRQIALGPPYQPTHTFACGGVLP